MNYAYLLSPGWLYGRRVDVSDVQFRTFRNNIGTLSLLALGYLVPSHLLRRLGYTSAPARARFIAVFAVGMLFGLHGWSVFKILAILAANYLAIKAQKPATLDKLWPGVIICANMGVLLLSRKYHGYHFSLIHDSLGALDRMNGILSWEISFNFSVLRIISFALDYHWRTVPPTTPPTDYRNRVKLSHPQEEYNFLYYLAYILYPPTYIAGPIMTFNDFMWQLRNPVEITLGEQVSYLVRFAGCMLTLESVLHTMYVTAMQKTKAWQGASAADLSMIGFWNLVIVWLKVSLNGALLSCLRLTTSSSSFRGASSACGRCWTGSIRRRTWCAASQTTIPRSASGGRGTAPTTSGLCDTSTSRSEAPSECSSPLCSSSRSLLSGTISRGSCWRGAGSWPASCCLSSLVAPWYQRRNTARSGGTGTSRHSEEL